MAAFLAETHEKLLRYFCSKFVRKDVMSKASTASKLIKIDLNDESNLVLYFGIKYKLKQLKSEKKLTDPQEFDFKFLIEMCTHLKEKIPLKSVFARSFKCFITSLYDGLFRGLWDSIPEVVEKVSYKKNIPSIADDAKMEYSWFVSTIEMKNSDEFLSFK